MNSFISPTKGEMSLEGMVQDIVSFVKDQPEKEYSIMVGGDSQKGQTVRYAISILVHRKGCGGRYFYTLRTGNSKISFQERILTETVYAIEIANQLKINLEKHRDVFKTISVPIHADVGEKGKTKSLIKTVTGMVLASGFEPVIKPEGVAACSVADKHSKFIKKEKNIS